MHGAGILLYLPTPFSFHTNIFERPLRLHYFAKYMTLATKQMIY